MKNRQIFAIAFLSYLVIGCGAKTEERPEELKSVVPQHQLKALENASKVEQTLLDADKERQKALKK